MSELEEVKARLVIAKRGLDDAMHENEKGLALMFGNQLNLLMEKEKRLTFQGNDVFAIIPVDLTANIPLFVSLTNCTCNIFFQQAWILRRRLILRL